MAYLQVSPLGAVMMKHGEDRGKKAFCVLEFAKTKSLLRVQQRFWTVYHTEPPMDKTFHEWHKKFQQSGCLCAAKRTNGWAWAIGQDCRVCARNFCQEPSEVNTSRELGIADASVKHVAHSAQASWPSWLLYHRVRISRRDLWSVCACALADVVNYLS
jgi:hypothetical protein